MSISLCKLAFLDLLSWSRPIRRMAANRVSVDSAAKSATVKVNGAGNGSELSRDPNLNPAVRRFRQLMGSSATESDGWDKCWDAEVTPWDLGQATPIVTHLVETGKLPDGRILVPGCGTGYDVVAMATPERFVVGLDISKTAVNKAKEVYDKNLEFAPIGLTQMYNSGGSVDEIDCSYKNSDFSLRIKGKGSGIFGAYSSRRPEICTLNSKPEEFQFSSMDNFLTLNIPGGVLFWELEIIF